MKKSFRLGIGLFLLLLALFILIPLQTIQAKSAVATTDTQRVIWPVYTVNQLWNVISGYNSAGPVGGGDHVKDTLYGLDIARGDGSSTKDITVKSPVSGIVQYHGNTFNGMGKCLFILIDGTSTLKMSLCHLNNMVSD